MEYTNGMCSTPHDRNCWNYMCRQFIVFNMSRDQAILAPPMQNVFFFVLHVVFLIRGQLQLPIHPQSCTNALLQSCMTWISQILILVFGVVVIIGVHASCTAIGLLAFIDASWRRCSDSPASTPHPTQIIIIHNLHFM